MNSPTAEGAARFRSIAAATRSSQALGHDGPAADHAVALECRDLVGGQISQRIRSHGPPLADRSSVVPGSDARPRRAAHGGRPSVGWRTATGAHALPPGRERCRPVAARSQNAAAGHAGSGEPVRVLRRPPSARTTAAVGVDPHMRRRCRTHYRRPVARSKNPLHKFESKSVTAEVIVAHKRPVTKADLRSKLREIGAYADETDDPILAIGRDRGRGSHRRDRRARRPAQPRTARRPAPDRSEGATRARDRLHHDHRRLQARRAHEPAAWSPDRGPQAHLPSSALRAPASFSGLDMRTCVR